MENIQYPTNTAEKGNQFEKWVTVYYYTAGILKTPAKGFNQTTKVTAVQMQAASNGFPMDDIVVYGENEKNENITLEIQATTSFSTSSKKLRKTFISSRDPKHHREGR